MTDFSSLRYDPERYITQKLGWTPWRGSVDAPGQCEIVDAYTLALRQMHERDEWEHGRVQTEDLQIWTPGQIIKNRLRVEAGHTVGKTKLSSGLVNHFFDCFTPSIIYTFAPTWPQIHDLLWKEIKVDRRGKGLPGRILDLQLVAGDNHFAKGTATNDAGGRGTERIQGQHGQYLMFVLDEAEGIPDFVFNAVDSMASGGICIVLMLANPRTRASRFYKVRSLSEVQSFRISCINHQNVVSGREVVPGAVRRDYVVSMIEKHCETTTEHAEDDHTFAVPFDVTIGGKTQPAGTIFKPNAEFMFRVLGVAPANIADNTMIPVGRFEAACKREAPAEDPRRARFGVDVAGFGKDAGTFYVRHNGVIWRQAQFWKQDYYTYAQAIITEACRLQNFGVQNLHIRIDAGGGFGHGVLSHLEHDFKLKKAFGDRLKLIPVDFGGTPYDTSAYANQVTEMYAEAAETLKGVRVENAPEALEGDLTERTYEWVNRSGVSVKILEEKQKFKKRMQPSRSPDDGDGFVLCAAPDHIFAGTEIEVIRW